MPGKKKEGCVKAGCPKSQYLDNTLCKEHYVEVNTGTVKTQGGKRVRFCEKCAKFKECGEFEKLKGKYLQKCTPCLDIGRRADKKRTGRDRSEYFAERAKDPEIIAKRKQWLKDNPDKPITYELTRRLKRSGKAELDTTKHVEKLLVKREDRIERKEQKELGNTQYCNKCRKDKTLDKFGIRGGKRKKTCEECLEAKKLKNQANYAPKKAVVDANKGIEKLDKTGTMVRFCTRCVDYVNIELFDSKNGARLDRCKACIEYCRKSDKNRSRNRKS